MQWQENSEYICKRARDFGIYMCMGKRIQNIYVKGQETSEHIYAWAREFRIYVKGQETSAHIYARAKDFRTYMFKGKRIPHIYMQGQ